MNKLEILKLLDTLFSKNKIYCGVNDDYTQDDYAICASIVNDVDILIKNEEDKIKEENDKKQRGLI